MPRRDQAARDVCAGCGRGARADRLDQARRCIACRIAAAVLGLPPAEARARRRELLGEHYRREAQLQARSRMLVCPRCGARRARWSYDDHPLCVGCQVRLEVEQLAEAEQ